MNWFLVRFFMTLPYDNPLVVVERTFTLYKCNSGEKLMCVCVAKQLCLEMIAIALKAFKHAKCCGWRCVLCGVCGLFIMMFVYITLAEWINDERCY